ncbi:hypothetical protein FGG08_003211 [Glutinoglossum americanum]|uniref:Aminoglycoside phosphotransferase domain-containing protein n=1 Tax=Glutinoglossum americanum TaxID=1670608 RepID=A0A9P8IBF7_9PEZI|nr:hypothetical protein FGG08_003211 [Glutinoglossum americanum]
MRLRPADKYSVHALVAWRHRYVTARLAMEISAIQKALWSVIPSPLDATLSSIKELTVGSLHTLYLLTMVDGSRLVLKIAPSQNARLLRHEQEGLKTEAEVLQTLGAQGQIPVPRVLKYDAYGAELGAPYILMEYVPGMPLKELHPCLDANDKYYVDRQLGRFFYYISATPQLQLSFGPLVRVISGAGFDRWGEAFLSLVEAVLRDAEDLVVLLPYEQIRKEMDRLSPVLDDVREARLVVMNEGYSNILLDSRTKKVTAVLDYGRVVLGDPMLSEIFATGSSAFFEGFGSYPSLVGRGRIRQLLYACYRAIIAVVMAYYRPDRTTIPELEARRQLLEALSLLAVEEGLELEHS